MFIRSIGDAELLTHFVRSALAIIGGLGSSMSSIQTGASWRSDMPSGESPTTKPLLLFFPVHDTYVHPMPPQGWEKMFKDRADERLRAGLESHL